LIVALEETAEEQAVNPLGLRIGGEARVEVGGAGFDEESDGGGIALIAVGAAGEIGRGKREEKKKREKRLNAEITEMQRAQRGKERRSLVRLD